MKKIAVLIIFLFSAFLSYGQIPNSATVSNSQTKYQIPNMFATLSAKLPVIDTTDNKATPYAGALTVLPSDTLNKDGIPPIYISNGKWWGKIAGGGGGAGVDSITFPETPNRQICIWSGGFSQCYSIGGYYDSTSYNNDSTYYYHFSNGSFVDSVWNPHTQIFVRYTMGVEDTTHNGFPAVILSAQDHYVTADSLYYVTLNPDGSIKDSTQWYGFSVSSSNSGISLVTPTTTTLSLLARDGKVVAIVTDTITGGRFNYSSESLTDNYGIIFPALGGGHWIRDISQSNGTNIKWFGAIGDGVTSDDAAATAAVVYCNSSGTSLYMPNGNYLILTNIWTDVGSQGRGLKIIGESRDKTRFIFTPSAKYTSLFNFWHSQLTIENLTVYNNSGTKNGIAFKFGDSTSGHDASRIVIRNVGVTNLTRGFDFQRAYIIDAYSVLTFGCDTAIFACVNATTFYKLLSEANNYGVVADANSNSYGYGFTLDNPTMESDSVSIKLGRLRGDVSIDKPYFENNYISSLLAGTGATDDVQQLTITGGSFTNDDSIVIDKVRQANISMSSKSYSPVKITGNCLDCKVSLPNASFDANNNTNGVVISAIDTTYNTAAVPIFRSDLSDVTIQSVASTDSVILFSSGPKKVSLNMTLATLVRDTINKVRGSQSAMIIPTQGVIPISGNGNYSDIPGITVKVSKELFTQRYGCVKLKVYVVNATTIGIESRAQMGNIFGTIVHSIWYAARMFSITSSTPNANYKGKWMWVYIPIDTLLAYNAAATAIGGTVATRRLDYIEFRVTSNYYFASTGGSVPSDSANRIYINEIEVYDGKFPSGNFVESKAMFKPVRLSVDEIKMPNLQTAAPSTFDNVVINNTSGILQRAAASGFQPLITWGSGLTYTGTTATNDVTTGKNVLTQSWIGSTQNNGNVIISANSAAVNGQIFFGSDAATNYNVSSHSLFGLTNLTTSSLFAPSGLLTIIHRENITTGIRFANNGTTTGVGNSQAILINDNFTTSTGTATRDLILANPTVNNSVGGTGIYSIFHTIPSTTGAANLRVMYDETDSGHYIYQANSGVKNSFFGIMGIGAAAGTDKLEVTGNVALMTAGNKLKITEGTNGSLGQTTLVAGTKAITITGLATTSRAIVTFVSVGGTVTTTWQYAAVCTSNTLTITALTNAGATNTNDTSVLNYLIVN